MKIKESTSKKIGVLTGKVVAGAKALPGKTANTSKSIKDEFVAGFASVTVHPKGKGNQSPAQSTDETQQ